MSIFNPKWFVDLKKIYVSDGIKGLIKKGGKKFFLAFFLFYLIRDTIIYIIPFYLASKGFISCF